MSEYLKDNEEAWNRWTAVHKTSDFYDVEGFRRGESSLNGVELEELGDVNGRSLLHLQCHFGLDTLSWARLGARATGVDFAADAIETARALAHETGTAARFVRSDVYDLRAALDERFEIVFTSYGVLWWLPDLGEWARVVRDFLAPGGVFYMVEFHPLLDMLGDDGRTLRHGYFGEREPWKNESSGTYADCAAEVETTSYGWPHGLGEIVSALAAAGLEIEWLREHRSSPYGCFPFTREVAAGWHEIEGLEGKVPMLFSLRAGRPAPAP